MGLFDRILANKALQIANRIAPVVSASILTIYAFSGKRLSIVIKDELPPGQKQALEARLDSQRSWFSYFFGGG